MESNFIKYDDNWSNGSGYTKAELIDKINNAKRSITDLNGKLADAQSQYDEANNRRCSGCGGRREPSCHDRCWAKESDKANRANDINVYSGQINTANTNIGLWQADLEVILEEERNPPTPPPAPAPAPSPAPDPFTPTQGGGTTTGSTTTTTQGGGSTPTRGGGTNTSTGGTTTTTQGGGTSSGTPNETKSKTGLYIGIGVGVLALGIITFAVLTRK